jgi:phage gp45-like
MSRRTTLTETARRLHMTLSRATVREFDDEHLMQEVKQADVHHSETPSGFERFQMVGLTSVPLKQEQDQNQQQQPQGDTATEGEWNHNQPRGKAAEAIMMYIGGSRAHPVAFVDDRRVRPYALKAGETALYAASGTGQMLFHDDNGSYLLATNNPQEQSQDSNEKERFASLRHVAKKKQSREIKQGQKIDDPKHSGETVNLEVRATSSRIEFRAGDDVVGYYDKQAGSWCFKGKVLLGDDDTSKMKQVHRIKDMDDAGNTAQSGAQKVWAL